MREGDGKMTCLPNTQRHDNNIFKIKTNMWPKMMYISVFQRFVSKFSGCCVGSGKTGPKMENITDVYVTDYIPTIYTTPCTMQYCQNGTTIKKGIFAERNGVLIIVYNQTLNVLILVKQFRASVYLSRIPVDERKGKIDTVKYPPSLGITLEFCAGLEDKNESTEQIAREEILEECGYDVPLSKLEKVATFKNLTETTGARSTLFYCEVTEEMRVNKGGGVDDEFIEVIEMPVEKVVEYAQRSFVNSPVNFMHGLYWFLYTKYKKMG